MIGTIFPSTSSSVFGMRPLNKKDFKLLAQTDLRCLELTLRSSFTDPYDSKQIRMLEGAVKEGLVEVHSGHADWETAMDVSSPDPASRAKAIAESRTCLEVIARLGGEILVIHPSWHPIQKGEEQERARLARESILRLTEHARRLGVRLAPEVMAPPCIPYDARGMLEILEGTDPAWVGACYDVNHGNLAADPCDDIRALGQRIVHFHISDNDGRQERHWMPFAGVVDWRRVMVAVREIGYAGALNFEVGMAPFADGTTLERSLKLRLRVFERLLELAGLPNDDR